MIVEQTIKDKIYLAQFGITEKDITFHNIELRKVRKKRLDSIRHLARRLANG